MIPPYESMKPELTRQQREVLRLWDQAIRQQPPNQSTRHRLDAARCRLARYTALFNAEGRIGK
jgi:hypothetical protein